MGCKARDQTEMVQRRDSEQSMHHYGGMLRLDLMGRRSIEKGKRRFKGDGCGEKGHEHSGSERRKCRTGSDGGR